MTKTESRERVVVADETRRQAADFLEHSQDEIRSLFQEDNDQPVPPELVALVTNVMKAVARGGTVTIDSAPSQLTTTDAARQLGISRTTLMKKIRKGEIPAHAVGSHHRLRWEDVQEFKRARLARQREALEEMNDLLEEIDQPS